MVKMAVTCGFRGLFWLLDPPNSPSPDLQVTSAILRLSFLVHARGAWMQLRC